MIFMVEEFSLKLNYFSKINHAILSWRETQIPHLFNKITFLIHSNKFEKKNSVYIITLEMIFQKIKL